MQSSLGQYQEVQQTGEGPFVLQNSKLAKAILSGGTLNARTGSMVAYQGELAFEAQSSGGVGKFLKKAFTSEGVDLMNVTGTGEVFLSGNGQEIHLVKLEGDRITCDGDNVLAFEQSIEWDINMVKGFGGKLAGGWTNMTLTGTGWVGLLSDGAPVLLNTGEAPTFVDPEAAIAWSSNLETELERNTGGFKSMLRGGTGESVSVGYKGQGWVLVQPAERALSLRVEELEADVQRLESAPG